MRASTSTFAPAAGRRFGRSRAIAAYSAPLARCHARRSRPSARDRLAHRTVAPDSVLANHTRLGTVEAPDEATAIEKAAAEFNVPANRLMAIRR
jgi:hypothetical protein